ncbi:DALR anticodon-binding domain-containing protein [Streptomyces polyrhachis]|uniref:arginine--tRNA ligase n=1 Tax=Streptomyces polyrhachis TaxID=1282885 RepID=A0ABW2GNQ3_9ACTN
MTPAQLTRTILRTVQEAVSAGELNEAVLHNLTPDSIPLIRPRKGSQGDWSTPTPLRLATPAALAALQIATLLARRLARDPALAEVTVTGPGFLNLTLTPQARPDPVQEALANPADYGRSEALTPLRYHLPPPTTPRAARWTAALDRILRATGAHPDPAGEQFTPHLAPLPAHDPAAYTEDALTWASLRPAAQDHPRLTPGLLVQREDNPLFLVRYAHARATALRRAARVLDIPVEPPPDIPVEPPPAVPYRSSPEAHPPPPGDPTDRLAQLPAVVESAARHRAPDRVARYAESLADDLLAYLTRTPCLPIGDEDVGPHHSERLRTAEAARITLANALHLLGVTTPEHL